MDDFWGVTCLEGKRKSSAAKMPIYSNIHPGEICCKDFKFEFWSSEPQFSSCLCSRRIWSEWQLRLFQIRTTMASIIAAVCINATIYSVPALSTLCMPFYKIQWPVSGHCYSYYFNLVGLRAWTTWSPENILFMLPTYCVNLHIILGWRYSTVI